MVSFFCLPKFPLFIFICGVLVGMSILWVLDARRASERLMARWIDLDVGENTAPSIYDRHEGGHHEGERILADKMLNDVRVFVFILTHPKSKNSKALHVKSTWARRFNGYIFVSSVDDPELPAIRGADIENYRNIWQKTRSGVLYAYRNILNDYDFFMKADDDTYVIAENLRYILSKWNPNDPILMGRRFKKYIRQGYTSGGAGYVLSRAALKLVAEGMLKEIGPCRKHAGAEDVNMGECAEAVGVKLVDSLDEHKQEVFHPFRPSSMLEPQTIDRISWIHAWNYFPVKMGLNCCSDHSVSFHYVSSQDIYVLEFLIYHLYPYGIQRGVEQYQGVMDVNTFSTGKH